MSLDALSRLVGEQLGSRGLTLATAESCSGGLLAHWITNAPGASRYFLGGVVTYSNVMKHVLLKIPHAVLEEHGAVSEPVAQQMAEGVRVCFHADIGVGITGIAGPGGGTPSKPVGLVYIAVAGPNATHVTQNHFTGERESIKEQTVVQALHLLLEHCG